jgi:hypothetical protein
MKTYVVTMTIETDNETEHENYLKVRSIAFDM